MIQGVNAVSKNQTEECKQCGGYTGHVQCPAKEPTSSKKRGLEEEEEADRGSSTFCSR
jgi:hypothetical protein